jgi:hypothetical protein
MFRVVPSPSSGAQITVSIASGICHVVTAICCYHGRVVTGLSVLWVACVYLSMDDACKLFAVLKSSMPIRTVEFMHNMFVIRIKFYHLCSHL